jgi:hypothetical protein
MNIRVWQAALFVFALSVGVRADMGGCQEHSGDFTSTLVQPPACHSPIGICTHGVLTGDVEGTYDFIMTDLVCGSDPLDPALCTYTGDSIVTSEKGTIVTKDTGVMHQLPPPALTPFVTTAEFINGTRRYKNATGVFVATGELNFITGEAVGTYSLQVCHVQ